MGKYTATQFIKAIPGTGGIIFAIAKNVGCTWNTAKSYIAKYPTIRRAWENERGRITDRAQHNVIQAIHGGDLHTSKWWLGLMSEEFKPPAQSIDHGGEITVTVDRKFNRDIERIYGDDDTDDTDDEAETGT